MKPSLLSLVTVLVFSLDLNAQCTITGTVNASSLTCSSFNGCSIIYVGDGTSATSIYMDANLDLSCLGTIQLVVTNNASLDFTPGNNRLTLGDGSSMIINPGGSLIGGSCNASERIYIGTNLLASCNGGAGADFSFYDLMTFGGTGSLTSNSPICTGNTLNLLAIPPPNGTYTYSFFGNGLPGGGTTYSSSPSYSLAAPATAGSYVYQVKMKSSFPGNPIAVAEITVVVNTGLATATPVTILTQTTCTVATGTITITSPTGSGMTYSINGLTYTNTTGIFSGVAIGTYSVTAKNSSGCISPAASVTINGQPTNTWNGTSWSAGSPPTSSQIAVFAGAYSSTGDITACSLQINSGVAVTMNAGHTLTIVNAVTVTGGGSLTFEDTASLLQTNDASVNTGNITYKRKTTDLKQYDYTYWSSPVTAATLSQLATNSLFYSYNSSSNGWTYQTGSTVMTPGVGYIGRAPSNLTYNPTQIVETTFTGVPNNGVINVPVIKTSVPSYNLIGNPYPSAIDLDVFIAANLSVMTGTVYLWTHTTPITYYQYTINDYAKYNFTGSVGTGIAAPSGGPVPTGKVAAAQGFFIEADINLASGTYSATFTNAARLAGNNNQFFKSGRASAHTATISERLERHRIWLSLSEADGARDQMLLGYVEGATDDFDAVFDSRVVAMGSPVTMYTKVGTRDLSIQGKSLPFSDTDSIPIAYTTTVNGELSINLDNFDGIFDYQDIYLLDKATNTLHDLKTGTYTFVTTAGTFENRFELRFTYEKFSAPTSSLNPNDVKIISSGHQLQVVSSAMPMAQVEVFDILGKLLFSQKGLNTNLFQTTSLKTTTQVVLVKIRLENQDSITKKIVIQ
ncbi:T9SS sorting signal type C domain-containing protein [Flavobacterium sangjuense]|uniref:Uncharacterized protein n=1 Tax=Flavobacterium sangjuense TaxID=2518177 RepID=A0A4P7PT12_9FLAO|nr:T9SS sorting signal type C domain-containing protein [Flavobacterium sangjuense]QBZ98077.1 hypothetical protein GS03_01582 [Flavobacterium sangjuense]